MARKSKKFKTEVQQLLDLVIHSLYTKKEIYLRELVSNASDAIDRLRFESLTDDSLLEGKSDWKIKITADKKARTLTISDNGIGMSGEELEQNIGTIASSGTKKFVQNMQGQKSDDNGQFIGQFGVGFYASFMVAEEVEIITRRAGAGQTAFRWVSKGAGSYTIEETEKPSRGTDVILTMRPDMDEFLDDWQIKSCIRDYSDYIAWPIVMDVTKTEKVDDKDVESISEETLNSMKAIWKRSKGDIKQEEYEKFYQHITHDFSAPMTEIHYHAEGTTEFKALLYIPEKAPMDMFMREGRRGVHLYVKNVFITDDCRDLLPDYFRFIRGVVDSSDLPLNVSREMLQDDAVIRKIQKSLVGKLLGRLKEMKEKKSDQYMSFYKSFGQVIKEGIHSDFDNQDKIKELLLFASNKTDQDKPVSLKEYVMRMPSAQKDIYYLTGENLSAVSSSPHLDIFRKKEFEVLFFTDPVDEFMMQRLTEYDGKKLIPIDRGKLNLDGEGESKGTDKADDKDAPQNDPGDLKDLVELLKDKLSEDVKEVRLSGRLTDSVCCLVADDMDLNANMERIMKAMNQDIPPTKRILEINADHPVIQNMKKILSDDKDDPRLGDYAELLRDQALITEGSSIKDPGKFAKLLGNLMAGAPNKEPNKELNKAKKA